MTATEYTAPEFDEDNEGGDDRQFGALAEQTPNGPVPATGNLTEESESSLDRDLDDATGHIPQGLGSEAGSFAEHAVPLGTRIVGKMGQIADEMGREDAAEDRLSAGIERAVQEQPDAISGDVDLAPIKAVEPDFDPASFRTIARETFLKVRDARGRENESSDDGLMSPALEQQVDGEIYTDIAARRHRILAGLEVTEAVIISAEVDGGREKIGVRFVATAEHIERDMATNAVLADDGQPHSWAELWQFERDPSVDATATDQHHMLSFGPDGWLFAHRGWVVTAITQIDG